MKTVKIIKVESCRECPHIEHEFHGKGNDHRRCGELGIWLNGEAGILKECQLEDAPDYMRSYPQEYCTVHHHWYTPKTPGAACDFDPVADLIRHIAQNETNKEV